MIYQLRTYTINDGMMDQWVKFFNETVIPIQENYGMRIEGKWVDEDGSRFIWIRSFADAEDLKAKETAFTSSPEWAAQVDRARSHIAGADVKTMTPA